MPRSRAARWLIRSESFMLTMAASGRLPLRMQLVSYLPTYLGHRLGEGIEIGPVHGPLAVLDLVDEAHEAVDQRSA